MRGCGRAGSCNRGKPPSDFLFLFFFWEWSINL